MNDRWTDERLDKFAAKVDQIADKIDQQGAQISRLIEALYLEIPTVRAEINSISAEAREQRQTLHGELVEIKEVIKQQAITAQTQAESIRMMIEMLNRKQA